jgi:hypothetical protein
MTPVAVPSSSRMISVRANIRSLFTLMTSARQPSPHLLGLFEYTCMPFGLRNAGNTFQRKIVSQGEKPAGVGYYFDYQDDLEVASKDNVQHRIHLQQVFLCLH